MPKKILTWMLREARGGLKAAISSRITLILSLYPHSFLFFSVSLPGYAQKHVSILHNVGHSQAEV